MEEDKIYTIDGAKCSWQLKTWYRAIKALLISTTIFGLIIGPFYCIISHFFSEMDGSNLSNVHKSSPQIGKLAIAYLVNFLATYHFLDSRFGNKWRYCANLFNQASDDKDCLVREYQYVSLAFDLIKMDLTNEKAFQGFFREQIRLSYGLGPVTESTPKTPEKIEKALAQETILDRTRNLEKLRKIKSRLDELSFLEKNSGNPKLEHAEHAELKRKLVSKYKEIRQKITLLDRLENF